MHARNGLRKPTGPQYAMATLRSAVDVHRRQCVRGGPAKGKSPWPDYVNALLEERTEAAKQRLVDWLAGDLVGATLPTAKEISTMDAVYHIFRACLVDKYQDQDWQLLQLLATPLGSLRRVGAFSSFSKDKVADRRDLQCAAIWKRVGHLMPEPRLLTKVL